MAWTNSRKAARSRCKRVALTCRGRTDEPFSLVYPPARRDVIADGRHSPGGRGSLLPVAGFGTAAGRLPDHSSADLLSRRQSVLTAFQAVEDNLAALRILEQEAQVQD